MAVGHVCLTLILYSMEQIYCVFRVNSINRLVDGLYVFADDWSRSSYLLARRHMVGRHFPITGVWVGQSRDRLQFLIDGWSCHADRVYNEQYRVSCWRFSSPLLPDNVYWHIDEFIERVQAEAKAWEITNKATK